MLRKVLIAAVVVVVVIAGGAFVLPSLIPADVYRSAIEQNAERALNRDVEVAGDVRASAFPSIQARAGEVTIANAEGFNADAFASVTELRARLALLPLLMRRVEIKEFVLVEPQIALEVAANGANNWTFSEDASTSPSPASGGGGPRSGAPPFDAALGDVRVVNGRASLDDRAAGVRHEISELNLRAQMPALSAPISVDASLLLDGEPVTFDLRLDSVRSFFEGEVSPFTANLDAGVAQIEVDGQFLAGQELEFSGDVRLASDDVKALAARAGAEIEGENVYNRFDISGRATGTADRVTFENARFEFDDIRATGELAADLAGARPRVTGDLAFGALDVTPYLVSSTGGEQRASGGGGAPPAWSDAPLDLAALRAVDADLTASAQSLKADRFEFGKSTLNARLSGGRLQIDIAELNAYQGSGDAQFVVDASGAAAQVSASADLANIQAEPFLDAAARFTRLAGAGSGRFTLSGAGRSQAEIMRSLDGSGSFDFQRGVLRGVDLVQAMSDLEAVLEGRVQLNAFRRGASTDFVDLAGQFTVEDGVARVREVEIALGDVLVPISGALDIGGQSLDVRFAPRRTNPESDGPLAGVGVPLRVRGAWGSVSAGVDDEALGQLVADLARREIESEIGDAVNDALGDDPAGDLLRGVLGLPQRTPADEDEAVE